MAANSRNKFSFNMCPDFPAPLFDSSSMEMISRFRIPHTENSVTLPPLVLSARNLSWQ